MRRACLVALLTLAVVSCVTASRILEDDAAAMGRQLLQADRTVCSAFCESNQCIRVGTTGRVKCNKCQNNMKPILSGVNAGQCGCPAGTYFDKNTAGGDCVVCPFGSYCFKQLTWVANTQAGITGKTDCTTGLTTRTRRSTSIWDCVNKGGYYLKMEATGPAAVACAGDTYAVAKSKQAACTPCPSGFKVVDTPTTDPRDKSTSCKVPAGYFLKSPGQIAPCDQGFYQPKYLAADQAAVGSCTACPEGVTTKTHGSTAVTDCKKLKPGYVATDVTTDGIVSAVLCPQGWYCPGDVNDDTDATEVAITSLNIDSNGNFEDTTYVAAVSGSTGVAGTAKIIRCPNSAWTKNVGATQEDQCMVPPGYELTGADISVCGGNTYRSEWISLAAATTNQCVACGTGILAEALEPVTLYSLNTVGDQNTDYIVGNIKVKASSKSCYIVKGQGMYYVPSGTAGKMIYKARNCGAGTDAVANSYGVAGAKVYGLAQSPCKLCPAGTKADTGLADTDQYKAANGFFDPLACVTKPGYGWDGRVATLCAKGWYNVGNNYKACTQCGYGLTTDTPLADGSKTDNADDCQIAPGFGMYDSKMQLCPVGYYNSALKPTTGTTEAVKCGVCASNTWTEEEGSDASTDCTVCKPGYGGASTAACAACGGDTATGTYGPPGRDDTETQCVSCPTSPAGFQFYYSNVAYPYSAPARAVSGAQDASDCVSAMAQIEDGLWYLASGADATTAVASKNTIADCADHCLAQETCILATFDYAGADANSKCRILEITEAGDDAVITAFKALPSSDVSQSRRLLAKPKAVSTGMYTQWKYDGSAIGVQTADLTATTKALCFDACDVSETCAGVRFAKGATNADAANAKCKLIVGVNDPQIAATAPLRSLTRAKPSLFALADSV